jgi:hypothetical protein
VGQKIAGKATDKRAIDTYNDAEAVLHEEVKYKSTWRHTMHFCMN